MRAIHILGDLYYNGNFGIKKNKSLFSSLKDSCKQIVLSAEKGL